MQLQKDSSVLQDYPAAIENEWLETNGLGGWSSSTIIGCNERRYHGLLVAATVPPVERMVLLSKMDETIITNEGHFELGTNNYGDAIHPQGYTYLKNFAKILFPEFTFEVGGITIRKTIAMLHNENTIVITYDIIAATQPFTLQLLPFFAVRNCHELKYANIDVINERSFSAGIFQTQLYPDTPRIFISVPGSSYQSNPDWFYHFNYSKEQLRGLEFKEDLFSHGKLSVSLKEGDSLGIIISTSDPAGRDARQLLLQESHRRKKLVEGQTDDEWLKHLVLASDQFIVKRNDSLKTVIAGYHWFTDWSRDTMISLPGLCLVTGRFEDAKKILTAFADSVSNGMLPNRFLDNGEKVEYNNA